MLRASTASLLLLLSVATALTAEPRSRLTILDRGSAWAVDASGTKVVGATFAEFFGSEAAYWELDNSTDPPVYNLPFVGSTAYGVSRSGETLVGSSHFKSNNEAFRWTEATGGEGLGHLDGQALGSIAWGVSDDGQTVVGEAIGGDDLPHGFRWSAGKMVDLGPGSATCVSADGQFSGGYDRDTGQAIRWSGTTPQPLFLGIVTDLSPDGSIAVGNHVIWTESVGTKSLGELTAQSVTADGGVVVGHVKGRAGEWRPGRGAQSLADVLIHDYGIGDQVADWKLLRVNDITPTGNAIVGTAESADGNLQFAYIVQLVDPFPGDANFDDRVDLSDFGILKESFGSGNWRDQGDFNRDFAVDLTDFGILKDNFRKSAAAVPEPSAFALGMLGLVAFAACRPKLLRQIRS